MNPVSTNFEIQSSATNLNSYTLDIDDTFDEMDFNSRGEAKDLYCKQFILRKILSDVKGIVTKQI